MKLMSGKRYQYGLSLAVTAALVFLVAGCSDNNTTQTPGTVDFNVYVLDEAGEALSGAKVVSEEQPEGQLKITGLTDDDGSVSFPSIIPGDYLLEISRFDYLPVTALTTVSTDNHELTVNMLPSTDNPPATNTPIFVTFWELLRQPATYNGQVVCVQGYYFSGFEISALTSALAPSDFRPGNVTPVQPLIWVTGNLGDTVSAGLHVQTDTPSGYAEHYGMVILTGLFEYGEQYGHLNAYSYRLTAAAAQLIP